jgi:hypothetical protein
LLSAPAKSWAVDAAKNEVLIVDHPGSYLRYRMHEVNERGDRVRDQIETPEGTVARLILRDGHTISTEEDAGERARLNALLASPSSFKHHVNNERDNRKSYTDLLNQMPDAMVWSYAPGQPQLPNQKLLVVLDFEPNSKWHPSSMAGDALTGIKGRVWVEPRSRRVVRVEAELCSAINVLGGLLAHINPPGNAVLQQTDTGNQRWIVEHIDEQVSGKALVFKSIRSRLVEDNSNFQPVPPMTYQQAIALLLNTPLPTQ